MEKILDGNSAAELQNDKGDIPQSIIEQARAELTEKAMDGLTFNTILDALSETSKKNQKILVNNMKGFRNGNVFIGFVRRIVSGHINPSETEVEEYANKLINEE